MPFGTVPVAPREAAVEVYYNSPPTEGIVGTVVSVGVRRLAVHLNQPRDPYFSQPRKHAWLEPTWRPHWRAGEQIARIEETDTGRYPHAYRIVAKSGRVLLVTCRGAEWLPQWRRPTAAFLRYTDDRRWEEWRKVALAELDEEFPT